MISVAELGVLCDPVSSVSSDEHDALDITRRLLAFLPSNNVSDPPHRPDPTLVLNPDPEMTDLVPPNAKHPVDILKIIARLVGGGDFLEVHRDFARNIVVGFGRISGIVIGVIANQPAVKAGTLDIDAADKAARFIRFCNIFNIPLGTLVDVPGFLPGVARERGGIIRHGAKMLFAYAAATAPKITVILRKAYGGAYLAMCSRDMGADLVFAQPTAEIAVMGAEGAGRILYKREIAATEAAASAAAYRANFATPYRVAAKAMITDVIEPAQTRGILELALRHTLSQRETRPPKKHGNIPL